MLGKRMRRRLTARPDSRNSTRNRLIWADGAESPRLEPRTLLTLTVTNFPIPLVAIVKPDGITTGPDGNLWFTETAADKIGRMTPAGVVTEFPLPAVTVPAGSTGPPPGPTEITAGPDGALWFIGVPGEVGRISTAGVVTEFAVPDVPPPAGSPPGTAGTPVTLTGITAGPDGALWFVGAPGEVGRISTAGVVTEFPVPEIPPPAGSSPGTAGTLATLTAITAGPDGALWFTGVPGEVGRISTKGVVTEFALSATPPPAGSSPVTLEDITAGPDGALWFTGVPGEVGRITTAGVVTEYATPNFTPAGDSNVPTITVGPDGNLWFIAQNAIGRITPTGSFTSFDAPGNFFTIAGLTSGPGGNLWFTEQEDGQTAGEQPAVGEITPGGVTKLYALPQGTTLNPNLGVPANPTVITAGPDGALWFAENAAIGRIATDGTIEQFPLNMPGMTIGAITSGPDDAIWFALSNNGASEGPGAAIGRLTAGGTITEYPLPARVTGVGGITEGPDHMIWFTENLWYPKTNTSKVAIGRITQQGHIKTFAVHVGKTAAKGSPSLGDIMPGPDGKLWFMGGSGSDADCLCGGNQVPLVGLFGQVTARGSIHMSERLEASPGQGNYPAGGDFISGTDGKLWYANDGGRAGVTTGSGLIRVSTSGAVSPAIPADNISPNLVRLPNGQVWFESGSAALGTATRSGIVVIQDLPGQNFSNSNSQYPSGGGGMAAGPDGNLWLTTADSSIVRISGLGSVSGSLDYRHRPKRAPNYAYDSSTGYDQWTNVSSTANPTFAGVAMPGAEVTLSVQKQGESQSVVIGQVHASSTDGSWTLKSRLKLSDGNYAVTATQTGDTSPPSVLYSLAPDSSGDLSSALVIKTPQARKGTGTR
jgi:streptogramin lyase